MADLSTSSVVFDEAVDLNDDQVKALGDILAAAQWVGVSDLTVIAGPVRGSVRVDATAIAQPIALPNDRSSRGTVVCEEECCS